MFEASKCFGKDQIDEALKKYEQACDYFTNVLEQVKNNIRDDSDKGTLVVYYHLFIRETKIRIDELIV